MTISKRPGAILIVLGCLLNISLGAFVGLNIGTDSSNFPSPSEVVLILQQNWIKHVRLYDSDSHMLKALANTGIEVVIGVTNEEVLKIGESSSAAASWVTKNVVSYLPGTNITAIAVGSEVLTSIPHAASVLVPAMNHLHSALVASNLNSRIKVSTPQAMDIISGAFPPSTASFNSSWNSTTYPLLQFLKNTNSYYMLNAYPYYGYTSGNGIFPLDYALFQPLSMARQIVDPNTLYTYDSMLDAMVDSVYYSMKAFNISGIPIVVTETGWPWLGGVDEPDAVIENAAAFTNNLVLRILNNSGTPSQPTIPINAYVYEMFNEDKRRGPVSEQHWGLFSTNGSAVYNVDFGASSTLSGISSVDFCVAQKSVDRRKLQAALDWACGPGGANCPMIQPGQPCFLPNTLLDHASYAFNDYYQRHRGDGGTCDFGGAATTTAVDPSHGSCVFPGSSHSTRSAAPISAVSPMSSQRGIPGGAHLEAPGTKLPLTAAVFTGLLLVLLAQPK